MESRVSERIYLSARSSMDRLTLGSVFSRERKATVAR